MCYSIDKMRFQQISVDIEAHRSIITQNLFIKKTFNRYHKKVKKLAKRIKFLTSSKK